MEHVLLALVLVAMGIPLVIFGSAVARRRFDLVFGEFTADSTDGAAWEAAHTSAGRGFARLGALLIVIGPVVALVGMPLGGWLAGTALTVLTIGVCVVVVRALGQVGRGQIPR